MLPMIFLLCFFVPQTSEETPRGRNNRNCSLFLLFSPLAAKTFDTDTELIPPSSWLLLRAFGRSFVRMHATNRTPSILKFPPLVTVLWSYYMS